MQIPPVTPHCCDSCWAPNSSLDSLAMAPATMSMLREQWCKGGIQNNPLSKGRNLTQFSSRRACAVVKSVTDAAVQEQHTAMDAAVQEQHTAKKNYSYATASNGSVLEFTTLPTYHRKYKENFCIRCYEVGANGTASIETVANLLQEVACNHARSVGFSTDGFATTLSMRKHRLIWVTTRMHIEIEDYPHWGDEVEIETWFQFEGRIGTRRDWVITNTISGQVIGRATSTWAMMDQDTRRLSRINDDVKNECGLYISQPPRWAFSDDTTSKKQILKLDDYQHVRSELTPRRADLDMNQHVNNVTYMGWMLESLPSEVLNTSKLHSITMEFRRECKHDDVVVSKASRTSRSCSNQFTDSPVEEFTHLVELVSGDKEVNRGRTTWKKIK